MSLIKNTAGQFLYAVLVNKNDGTAITSGATLSLAKDGGAGGAAGATLTHRIGGLWEAALTQADTNGSTIGYVWAGTNVIPQGGTIITVDYPRNAIGDILTAINTGGVAISTTTAQALADITLKRDWNGLSGEPARCLLNAGRLLRNKHVVGLDGILRVYEEDDSTEAWNAALTLDPTGQPITGVDPT